MGSLREQARQLSAATGLSCEAARARLRRHARRDVRLLNTLQTACCAICGHGGRLHLDHSHATGATRGLLCSHCNHGLGNFFDSTVLLEKAIAYLKNPPAQGLPGQPTGPDA